MAKSHQKFGRVLKGAELKRFRSDVSRLKKQGLIKKSIDARTARPYFLSNGKSLQSIVNKSHEPTKLPKQKLADLNSPFSLRSVPGIKNKSLAAMFNEIERDPGLAAEINALKRPGERFAFQIEGMPSYHAYPDIELLIEDAFKYVGSKYADSIYSKRQKSASLGNKLKLIRWKDGDFAWQDARKSKVTRAVSSLKKKRASRRR